MILPSFVLRALVLQPGSACLFPTLRASLTQAAHTFLQINSNIKIILICTY